jgi:DNA polymerase III subunit delta'
MKFSDIIGQEKIKQQLVKSVENKKLSHAVMLLGSEGNGSLALAIAFAQYVNCENKTDVDSCGECPSCIKSSKYVHPDIHFSFPVIKKDTKPPISLDYIKEWRKALTENPYMSYLDWLNYMEFENKQGNITIEECHSIIKTLSLKAFEGNYKVLIMWLPEFLGKSGNTLLKIIEEPSPNTLFIFVAYDRESILNTILSRTQIIPIPKLSVSEITDKLISDHDDITKEVANAISLLADGNYTEAVRLMNSGDIAHFESFTKWMRACWYPNMIEIYQWVQENAEKGRENIKDFLLYSLRMIRECALVGFELNKISKVSDKENEFVLNFSKRLNGQNLPGLYEALNKAYYHVERNANPKILFFDLSLQVHQLIKN